MGSHQIRHEVGLISSESWEGWHASVALFTQLRQQKFVAAGDFSNSDQSHEIGERNDAHESGNHSCAWRSGSACH